MAELICIYFGGFLTLFIAFYHTQLYSKLNWSEDFEKIDKANAQVFYTINLALTLLFTAIGCSGQQKTDTRVKLQADMLASRRLPG